VMQPARQGFGYSVLVPMVQHALDAEVALDYHLEGVLWRIDAPIRAVCEHPIKTMLKPGTTV
jgi:hypothetical protein